MSNTQEQTLESNVERILFYLSLPINIFTVREGFWEKK